MQTACHSSESVVSKVRVTHVFHPLYGRELELLEHRRTWQRRRVYFLSDAGATCSLPEEWTSVVPADPFVAVSNGHAKFRVEDLLRLRGLLDVTSSGSKGG